MPEGIRVKEFSRVWPPARAAIREKPSRTRPGTGIDDILRLLSKRTVRAADTNGCDVEEYRSRSAIQLDNLKGSERFAGAAEVRRAKTERLLERADEVGLVV